MRLTKLFAFEVFAQKNRANPKQPSGGNIRVVAAIRDTLEELADETNLESETPIAFVVTDPHHRERENETRQLILDFCFGNSSQSKNAASELARQLSVAMDKRSKPFLLLFSRFELDHRRKVIIWAFPKDHVFKFTASDNGVDVQLIQDVFSVSSRLRKAALFEGTEDRDDFWEGHMLDLQSGTTNFWIEDFLRCRLAVSGSYGTQRLARYLAETYKNMAETDDREQIFNTIAYIRTAPVRRMSFLKFAKQHLNETSREYFLSLIPDDERSISFDFERSVFEKKLGFRVFRMCDDVFVSAPLEQIGTTVRINGSELKYRGEIQSEYLKASVGMR